MKKLLIGLTLLGSMSTFAETKAIDLNEMSCLVNITERTCVSSSLTSAYHNTKCKVGVKFKDMENMPQHSIVETLGRAQNSSMNLLDMFTLGASKGVETLINSKVASSNANDEMDLILLDLSVLDICK
jgi:uncharacterized protein related to proFAR isomerase